MTINADASAQNFLLRAMVRKVVTDAALSLRVDVFMDAHSSDVNRVSGLDIKHGILAAIQHGIEVELNLLRA
jgi:hypothetical protein